MRSIESLRAGHHRGDRGLPERERLVMSLYYEQELNLKEIGAVLKVTESRVCQLHGQALVRLKARLDASGSRLSGAAKASVDILSIIGLLLAAVRSCVGAMLKGAGVMRWCRRPPS